MNRRTKGVVALGVIGSALSSPAYAYLDPGTGSMLLQLILGGVAGALVVGKLYWHRLKAFVTRRPDLGQAGDDARR